MSSSSVRQDVDVEAIELWLRSQGLPSRISDLQPLAGGSQNIVMRARIEDRRLVLRLPPVRPRAHSNRALVREMRILKALAGTDVPHPGFYAGTDDESVLGGPVFYFMDEVVGFNPGEDLPDTYRNDPSFALEAGRAVAGVLGALGNLDPAELGIADIGNPTGFVVRQIERQLVSWREFVARPGYDTGWLANVEGVATWLLDDLPTGEPGITHGDYHLNNVFLANDAPVVAAVLDWEMCTIGDPMVDLAWLLMCVPDRSSPALVPTGQLLTGLPGFPSRSELVKAYREVSSRSVDRLDWYIAFVCFKYGLIIEGNYVRSLDHPGQNEWAEYSHELSRQLLAMADAVMRGITSPID